MNEICLFWRQVAVLEEILNGGEGNKFKATADIVLKAQKSMDSDGKITSSTCSIQWKIKWDQNLLATIYFFFLDSSALAVMIFFFRTFLNTILLNNPP